MKPIIKVFLVIGALVLSLVVWGLFFNGGGVLQTSWNTVIAPVNDTWTSLTGSDEGPLPAFEDTGAGGDTTTLDVNQNMGSGN